MEAQREAERAGGKHYTVADAVAEYLDYLSSHGKSAADSAIKLKAYVLPQLGSRRLADLKPADFDAWLDWAMKRPFARRVGKAAKRRRTSGHKARSPSSEAGRRRNKAPPKVHGKPRHDDPEGLPESRSYSAPGSQPGCVVAP